MGFKEEFPTVGCHIFKKGTPMLRLLLTRGGGRNGFISSMGMLALVPVSEAGSRPLESSLLPAPAPLWAIPVEGV